MAWLIQMTRLKKLHFGQIQSHFGKHAHRQHWDDIWDDWAKDNGQLAVS